MLRRRTHFRAYPYTKGNGVRVIGWVSAHDTLVTNRGDPKFVASQKVLDPGRGLLCLQLQSDGTFSRGGFAGIDGKVRALIVGKVSGNIVILFSNVHCDSAVAAGRPRDVRCDDPPDVEHPGAEHGVIPPCHDPDSDMSCIYCVHNDEHVGCTIEQDTVTLPCGPYGADGTGRILPYLGATIIPNQGNWDIYGNAEPYYANSGGRLGRVKYYLKSFRGKVDPVMAQHANQHLCGPCGWWLCHIIYEYAAASDAWVLQCTDVRKLPPATELGACCLEDGSCWDGVTRGECEFHGGTFLGPGSECEFVDCEAPPGEVTGCCLPNGNCVNYLPADCVEHGGLVLTHLCASDHCDQFDDPNLAPRNIAFDFPYEQIGFVEFSFAGLDPWNQMQSCFHLADNFCFSGGPDPEIGDPYWSHVQDARKLNVLDSMDVVMDMRIASDPEQFPHPEPECTAIANAVLREVGGRVTALTSPGHQRMNGYNHYTLNRWRHSQGFGGPQGNVPDCGTSPAIWPVSVIPYKTGCAFPADLILWQVWLQLFISGDPGNVVAFSGDDQDFFKIRIAAVFTCRVELKVRLRPGWEDIPCSARMTNDLASPCDPVLEDPDQYVILASDGCTRVPLVIEWKGIQGPRPWSKGPFYYYPHHGGLCCTLLHAIDGLLIPGEVDDTDNPDGLQHYDGDVVISVQEPFPAVGC